MILPGKVNKYRYYFTLHTSEFSSEFFLQEPLSLSRYSILFQNSKKINFTHFNNGALGA
jgi:hypothetical protein